MALFIKQDETRTKLQEQIAAELQAKMKKRDELGDRPDGVEDSRYLKDTERSTAATWVWVVIIAVVVVIIVVLIVKNLTK
jgi:uncharacterized integral membrane protein